ncbi:MAG: hypothetical protein U0R49_11510 [Fimbriimonadales bacterium]
MAHSFPLGQIVMTKPALTLLHPEDVQRGLARHATGDWGDICEDDWIENERSIKEGFRLFSVYSDRDDHDFWIITEADRSSTTVLLPDDY